MGCPALFRLLPTSAASASLRLLPIGPKRASGQGCDEWSGVRGVPAPKANEPSSPKLEYEVAPQSSADLSRAARRRRSPARRWLWRRVAIDLQLRAA
jgi:hypothetical protein